MTTPGQTLGPVPRVADQAAVKLSAAPSQDADPVVAIENAQDSYYRPLTGGEVDALKKAASWEVKIAQVVGFATIGWGLIGFFAPVNPEKFGIIGLVPGAIGVMTGLAAKQKFATANLAIASGRAVEYMGVTRAEGKNMRRIDFEGGSLRFTSQRIPKALNDATSGGGVPVKVTFTEGGTETLAGTETMILAVNGAVLPVPVLGQVGVTQ
ncbi:MAG: hypothetical protein Q8N53_03500 [Longimicrobiales bacterium]|nr:hypothetical protein [Longimicrobiales bacterium]